MPISTERTKEIPSLLITLKQQSITGRVEFLNSSGLTWDLHFCGGRIFFASGGRHPRRRWYRQVSKLRPNIKPESLLDLIKANLNKENWDYCWLCQQIDEGLLTRNEVSQIISNLVMEVLLDIARNSELNYRIHTQSTLTRPLIVLDPLDLSTDLTAQLQTWQRAQIIEYCPDYAPIIRHPDQLRSFSSAQLYQTLTYLCNGQRTLKDIALLMKHPVVAITGSIAAYLKAGIITLTEVNDLMATPVVTPHLKQFLIASIDDNAWVCQNLEQLLTSAGYRFISMNDPTRAIPQLLREKPHLIFLDLRMPNTNGYEICSQLRKLSQFQHTPIIILTGNDGIVDRVRARLAGATDFISKSTSDSAILRCIETSLNINANTNQSIVPNSNSNMLAVA